MTDILIEEITEKHKDLEDDLKNLFKRKILDNDPLNTFYTEVSRLFARHGYKHLIKSQNFYELKKFVNQQINTSFEDLDSHLLNQTLKTLHHEIIQIIEDNI